MVSLFKRVIKVLAIANIIPFINGDCLKDPTDKNCSTFVYKEDLIQADINRLCKQMDYMPGCSINSLCNSNKALANEPYCNSFSILADVCKTDMPGMGGCENYVSLCNNKNSLVPQCKINQPISNLPSTDLVNKQVKSICNEMAMDGCEKCSFKTSYGKCDLLAVYSQLCQAMPEMSQCGEWKTMCPGSASEKPENNLPYCQMNGNGDTPPQMRMYFHTGLSDYVLFKEWVPRNGGQYAGTFIAIIVMGLIYEFLLTVRNKLELGWGEESIDQFKSYSARQFQIDSYRAAFQFVESSIAYLLMLVSMTFNVGLFFAVILGISLGTLIFSRFRAYGTTKRPCGC